MSWKSVGRALSWPVRAPLDAIGRRIGTKIVEGALDTVSDTVSNTVSDTPASPVKETPPMLGVNTNTTVLGWATILFQILKILLPVFTGQGGPDLGIEDPPLLAAGLGLLRAKDGNVTGVGANARKVSE